MSSVSLNLVSLSTLAANSSQPDDLALGERSIKQGQFTKGLEILGRFLSKQTSATLTDKEKSRVENNLNNVLKLTKSNALKTKAHLLLGDLYDLYSRGMDVSIIKQEYEAALALSPNDPLTNLKLGDLYARDSYLQAAPFYNRVADLTCHKTDQASQVFCQLVRPSGL